jgi:hypothetical protein
MGLRRCGFPKESRYIFILRKILLVCLNTANDRLQSKGSLCGLCGVQSDTGIEFFSLHCSLPVRIVPQMLHIPILLICISIFLAVANVPRI